MHVLFIGGTGRLSKDVVAYAIRQGYDVSLLTRGSKKRAIFIKEKCKLLKGNIRNPKSCKKYFQKESLKYDVVIDFLSFEVEDVRHTISLIKGHFTQYIFISSATVFKKTDNVITEESDKGNSLWEYAYNKYLCEEYIKEYFKKMEDSFYTIIRPYVTYDNTRVPYPLVPRNKKYEWSLIERIKNNQIIPIFDDGTTETALLHTKDFAFLTVGLFGNKNAFNNDFNIADNNTTTWGNVLDTLEKCLDIKVYKENFEQNSVYKFLPQFKSVLLGDKGHNIHFNTKKITNAVAGYVKTISLETGLKEMIAFYEMHPDRKMIDYYWNGQVDRLLLTKGIKNKYEYHFNKIQDKIKYYAGKFELLYFPYLVLQKLMNVKNPFLKRCKYYVRQIILSFR